MKMMTTILSSLFIAFTVFADTGSSSIVSREIIGGAEVITIQPKVSNILDLKITSYTSGSLVARLNTETGYNLALENNVAQPVRLYLRHRLIAGTVPAWELMRVLWSLGREVERGCDISIKLQVEPLKILQIVKRTCKYH